MRLNPFGDPIRGGPLFGETPMYSKVRTTREIDRWTKKRCPRTRDVKIDDPVSVSL